MISSHLFINNWSPGRLEPTEGLLWLKERNPFFSVGRETEGLGRQKDVMCYLFLLLRVALQKTGYAEFTAVNL